MTRTHLTGTPTGLLLAAASLCPLALAAAACAGAPAAERPRSRPPDTAPAAQPQAAPPRPGGELAGSARASVPAPAGDEPTDLRSRLLVVASEKAGQLPAFGVPAAFDSLADLLGELGPETAPHVRELRAEASALSRLDMLSFEHAARARAGLEHALRAIEVHAEARRAAWLRPWTVAAGAALAQLDEHRPLGLQRPVLQDALRSAADAALLARAVEER